MHRFFVDGVISNNEFKIYGNDFNHIKKVLRISENEKIEIVNNKKLYLGNIKIFDDYILVYNLVFLDENTEMNTKIHLLQCILKGEKMDFVIQKSVELGVFDITLINSKRCIVKIDKKKESKKIERLNKISYEASKQSKRMIVPEVKGPIDIKEVINFTKDAVVLVAYEQDKDISLKEKIKNINKNSQSEIYILIGPEGGFDKEEIEYLTKNKVLSIGLGKRILRAETAGICCLSILQYEFI